MLGDILKRTAIGFLAGTSIGDIIVIILGYAVTGSTIFVPPELVADVGSELNAFALQTFLSGVYGAICMGFQSLYYIESFPLAAATFVHYAVVVLCYAPVAFFLRWVGNMGEFTIVAAVMSVVYLFIWLSMYMAYKAQIKELNVLQKSFFERIGNAEQI